MLYFKPLLASYKLSFINVMPEIFASFKKHYVKIAAYKDAQNTIVNKLFHESNVTITFVRLT